MTTPPSSGPPAVVSTHTPPDTSVRECQTPHTSGGLARPPVTGFVRTPSPVGRIELRSQDGSVSAVRFERGGRLPLDDAAEQPTSVLLDAVEQLDEYFRGDRREFELPILTTGTVFQHAVWDALREVPFGSAVGYGALAASARAPGGGRAAGQAVRANALALLVPCHRVLAAGDRVTGYSGGEGPATKRWLLDHEGIPYRR